MNDHLRLLPCNKRPQTDREIAEMIAKFRTPVGSSWKPLADDIETLLRDRPRHGP